uniref:Uncharacterized protein n=1 Tax=Avena sativa TaxID=4498 RepID=A0ACD5YVF7_AVESA
MQALARLSSASASRRVISGVSGAVTRPSYRTWRGKAHAALLSSQDPPTGRKREFVPKKERKARIEEFIEIYQTSNDGKFPTIQMIRQHVGGGHYTVRDVLQEVKYNQIKFPFDRSKIAQLHETDECADQSKLEEESGNSSLNPQSINGKPDEDDTLPSEKDSATGTVIMNEPWRSLESQDSSHYNGQTEVAKLDLHTADANVSEHTEIDSMKTKLQLDDSKAAQLHETAEFTEQSRQGEESGNNSFNPQDFNVKQDEDDTLLSQKDSSTGTIIMENTEAPIPLELETKSVPENRQGETEVNKLHVNNVENFQNPSEPTVSDQTESGKVIKGNVLDREENPEAEQQGSAKSSLLGSLKSFASGIRNFWRNL